MQMNSQFIDRNAVDCWTTDALLNDYPVLITNDCPVAPGNHIWTAVWLPLLATTFFVSSTLANNSGKTVMSQEVKKKVKKQTEHNLIVYISVKQKMAASAGTQCTPSAKHILYKSSWRQNHLNVRYKYFNTNLFSCLFTANPDQKQELHRR